MTRVGKFWTDSVAYVALLTGAGLSIAGNVANVLRTRGDAVDNLDVVLAVAFPGLVVLMVEVFVSSRWRGLPWYMQTLRWLGTLSIGAMAMRVSWVHLNALMSSRGQEADVAVLGPLAIDFLAIMATALILAGRGQDKPSGHVDTFLGQPHPVAKDAPEGWTDRLDKPAMDTGPSMSNVQASTWQDDGHGHEVVDSPDMSNVQALDTGRDKPNVHAPTMVDVDKALTNYLLWLVQDGKVSNVVDMDTADVHDWTERLANLAPVTTPVDSEEDIFARLEREMTNRPPSVAAVAPVSPAPAGRARPSRMTAEQSARALEYARVGREHGLLAKEIMEALAAWAGVSTRTIRRLPWWAPLMEGSQAS